MKQYEKDALMEHGNSYVKCTLDGKPARIAGRLDRFATIWNEVTSVEFSWCAVGRILDDGGVFKSNEFPV